MMTTKHKEYCKSATRAGLHYVTDGFAGFSRRRSGTGWKDVWICPDPEGHIQVTVRDARGRKQYQG